MNKIYIRGNEIATKEYVDSLSLGGDESALENYYTKEEVNNLIENSDGGNTDLSNYYTKEEINNVIAEINNTIQKEIMPDPSEDNVGTIVQYIGDTNNTYTTGYFYQIVEETIINEDGTETIIYKWEEIKNPEINLEDFATKEYVNEAVANNNYGKIYKAFALPDEDAVFNVGNGSAIHSLSETLEAGLNDFMKECIKDNDYHKILHLGIGQVNGKYTSFLLTSYAGKHHMSIGGKEYYKHIFKGVNIDSILNNNGKNQQQCIDTYELTIQTDPTAENPVADTEFYRYRYKILEPDNKIAYIPTGDYNPATKKYVDDTIATSIAGISATSMEIATSLPTENISTSTIYLVKDETASTDTGNVYNEYIYINGVWENIGSTKTTVDLSQYSTTEELSQMLSSTLANYLTTADLNASLSNYYTKTATDSAIAKATQKGIQAYYTMPEQNSENAGKVYQYLGTTNNQFIKGHFYYLEENVDISPSEGENYSYNWIELETQNPTDLSKYSTTAQMNEAISNAVNGIETGSLSSIGDTLDMSTLEDGLYTWEGNKINTGSSTISAQMVNSPTTVLVENGKAYFHTNTGDLFVLDKATMNIKQINYMSDTLVYESDLSNYYTKTEINTMIGDINSILDAINGEEV